MSPLCTRPSLPVVEQKGCDSIRILLPNSINRIVFQTSSDEASYKNAPTDRVQWNDESGGNKLSNVGHHSGARSASFQPVGKRLASVKCEDLVMRRREYWQR